MNKDPAPSAVVVANGVGGPRPNFGAADRIDGGAVVAVGSPKGLLVPTVPNAGNLNPAGAAGAAAGSVGAAGSDPSVEGLDGLTGGLKLNAGKADEVAADAGCNDNFGSERLSEAAVEVTGKPRVGAIDEAGADNNDGIIGVTAGFGVDRPDSNEVVEAGINGATLVDDGVEMAVANSLLPVSAGACLRGTVDRFVAGASGSAKSFNKLSRLTWF